MFKLRAIESLEVKLRVFKVREYFKMEGNSGGFVKFPYIYIYIYILCMYVCMYNLILKPTEVIAIETIPHCFIVFSL
jgi:hypothetical protein